MSRIPLSWLCALASAVVSTSPAVAQGGGDQPLTPEQRIKAATVPPPGKECPPDPEEATRVDGAADERALRLVTASAAETVSVGERAVYDYWNARRIAFDAALKERQEAVRSEPRVEGSAVHPFLGRDTCVAWATRDSDACQTSASNPREVFQCKVLASMARSRGPGIGDCKSVPPWFGPTCRLVFEDAPEACTTAIGRARKMCDLVRARLNPPGGICAAPLDALDCAVEISLLGVREGVGACVGIAANAGLSPALSRSLEVFCRATVTGEAALCEQLRGTVGGSIRYESRVELQGGLEGVRAVVGIASDTPVACAVEVLVRDGEREMSRTTIGGAWSGGGSRSVASDLLSSPVDPFRHRATARTACVPVVAWESPAGS